MPKGVEHQKQFLITLTLSLMDTLALFFSSKDPDTVGSDDRIARIIGNAAQELRVYLSELPLEK